MYEESELSYFKGGLAVGIGLGLLSGVASTIWYHRKKVLSADQVLENIKTSFLKEGAIEGAWISFEKNLFGNSPFGRVLIGVGFPG
ncbi:hypothetical protein JE001_31960 [Pseudomonas aeruginosa]|nr:hypothetical protein [Pseudomonas aeruginosa]